MSQRPKQIDWYGLLLAAIVVGALMQLALASVAGWVHQYDRGSYHTLLAIFNILVYKAFRRP